MNNPAPVERPALGDADAQRLCKACGLCCTGVWFSHVVLEAGELEPARLAGLRVEIVDGQERSHQPCALHHNGQCSGYQTWRPLACASFRCQLLDNYMSGTMAAEEALGHVRAAKEMAERVRAELGTTEGGLLGPNLLNRINDEVTPPAPGQLPSSPATRLDAVALNLYYTKYFKKRATSKA